jgi:hypothetical protein
MRVIERGKSGIKIGEVFKGKGGQGLNSRKDTEEDDVF